MQLFTNNADSSLNGAIDSAALSLTLKTGEGAKFPAPTGGDFFLATLYQKVGAAEINHEIVKCTARAGDVLTVVRAQEATTAKSFGNGDPIELRLTAGAAQAALASSASASVLTLTRTTGRITSVTEDGVTTTITYNADGTVNTVSYPRNGKTRTETYAYTSGALTGMTATEA